MQVSELYKGHMQGAIWRRGQLRERRKLITDGTSTPQVETRSMRLGLFTTIQDTDPAVCCMRQIQQWAVQDLPAALSMQGVFALVGS